MPEASRPEAGRPASIRPAPASFDYAILRVVPRVEREEFINAGVVVFCLERRYLDARILLNEERLRALWPEADIDLVRLHLDAIPRICMGDRQPDRLRSCRSASAFTGSPRRAAPSSSHRRCTPGCATRPKACWTGWPHSFSAGD